LRQEASKYEGYHLGAIQTGVRELHHAIVAGADDYLITPFTSLQMDEKLSLTGLICHRGDYVIGGVCLTKNNSIQELRTIDRWRTGWNATQVVIG